MLTVKPKKLYLLRVMTTDLYVALYYYPEEQAFRVVSRLPGDKDAVMLSYAGASSVFAVQRFARQLRLGLIMEKTRKKG